MNSVDDVWPQLGPFSMVYGEETLDCFLREVLKSNDVFLDTH
jgi:hypothetical protein